MSGDGRAAEASAIIRARVDAAREIQRQRFQAHQGIYSNAHMTARDVRRYCWLAEPVEALLRQAITKLGLSARAYSRVLKVARTIADLASEPDIGAAHVSEAIQYRVLDRARMAMAARG